MRILVGIESGGRVTEMLLPDGVPVAHLAAEVLALVGADHRSAGFRRVAGGWLDPEQTLEQQGVTSGSLLCVEERAAHVRTAWHDPVAELIERGPPVDLIPGAALPVVLGGLLGSIVASASEGAAALVVAAVPVAWALLPLLGGRTAPGREWVNAVIVPLGAVVGGAGLAAAGTVAAGRPAGLWLVSCVVVATATHVVRRHSQAPLARVILGGTEWSALGGILPITTVVTGWVG